MYSNGGNSAFVPTISLSGTLLSAFLLHPVNSIEAASTPANATVKNFFIIFSPFKNEFALYGIL